MGISESFGPGTAAAAGCRRSLVDAAAGIEFLQPINFPAWVIDAQIFDPTMYHRKLGHLSAPEQGVEHVFSLTNL